MVRRVPSARRSTARPSTSRARSLHRRFGYGLGRLSCGRPAVQLVASGVLDLFDQPLGTPSDPLRCSRFSAGSSGSFGVSFCGQYDSSVLPSETRRDSFFHSEHCCPGHTPSLRGPSCSACSAVYSGSPERFCGLSQPPFAGLGLRMDPCHQAFRELLRL